MLARLAKQEATMLGTSHKTLSNVITVLWVIWGLVHMFAGVVVMSSDATGAIQAIADGTDPASLVRDYPGAAGAILNQHGWNLLWAGAITTLCGVLVWRGNLTALWLAALVGGCSTWATSCFWTSAVS